jgi:catechol 2,3-dioxygenase-like lactoylglutathione lyase family enzyme
MSVLGIDEISYGADDLAACRQFFLDWGLSLAEEQADRLVFETLNGCRVIVAATNHPDLPPAIEAGPTLREVVWGVESEADLALYEGRIAAGLCEAGRPERRTYRLHRPQRPGRAPAAHAKARCADAKRRVQHLGPQGPHQPGQPGL